MTTTDRWKREGILTEVTAGRLREAPDRWPYECSGEERDEISQLIFHLESIAERGLDAR